MNSWPLNPPLHGPLQCMLICIFSEAVAQYFAVVFLPQLRSLSVVLMQGMICLDSMQSKVLHCILVHVTIIINQANLHQYWPFVFFCCKSGTISWSLVWYFVWRSNVKKYFINLINSERINKSDNFPALACANTSDQPRKPGIQISMV